MEKFVSHFRKAFGRPKGDSSLSEQLYYLKQGRSSIQDYALQFHTLAAVTQMEDQVGHNPVPTFRQPENYGTPEPIVEPMQGYIHPSTSQFLLRGQKGLLAVN